MERNPSLVFPELFDLPSRNSNGRANIFAISSSPNRPIHRFRSLIEATFGLFINAELFRVNYSGSTLSDYWTINNFEYFASKQRHEWTGLERDKNRLLPDQLFLLLFTIFCVWSRWTADSEAVGTKRGRKNLAEFEGESENRAIFFRFDFLINLIDKDLDTRLLNIALNNINKNSYREFSLFFSPFK